MKADVIGIGAVLAATLACLAVVPDWPHRHLDDPSYWGVIGYGLAVLAVGRLRLTGRRGTHAERRLLALFLAGMPVVYLACGLRFGASAGWMLGETAAALVFWGMAVAGLRRRGSWLAVGIVAHGMWDTAHHSLWPQGLEGPVPDWYVVACLLIDGAVGLYAAAQAHLWSTST